MSLKRIVLIIVIVLASLVIIGSSFVLATAPSAASAKGEHATPRPSCITQGTSLLGTVLLLPDWKCTPTPRPRPSRTVPPSPTPTHAVPTVTPVVPRMPNTGSDPNG